MKEVDQMAAARPFVAARLGRMVRWTGAAMLAVTSVPLFAATPLELAHEVNTQIVTRQVLNEGQDFLRAFGSGEGISSPEDPPACRQAIQTAMAGFLSAGVKRLADGIQDPAGQAAFDQVLIQSYTAAELKAFLAQRDEVALSQLMAAVLAAPKVRAANDARMEVFTLGDPDPASPEGMGMQRAKETCDRLRAAAG
ncbi:hypothetical protein [Stenotrophomonas chelatiphaga]|uniref:hypothetical protein n=1 Tax=Stenotrophomonas chelatiphaga TaxID=517011 RepID=UPI0028993E11|nr:hypothetical protein [Stenotrophomonas chelatiphaga]